MFFSSSKQLQQLTKQEQLSTTTTHCQQVYVGRFLRLLVFRCFPIGCGVPTVLLVEYTSVHMCIIIRYGLCLGIIIQAVIQSYHGLNREYVGCATRYNADYTAIISKIYTIIRQFTMPFFLFFCV